MIDHATTKEEASDGTHGEMTNKMKVT